MDTSTNTECNAIKNTTQWKYTNTYKTKTYPHQNKGKNKRDKNQQKEIHPTIADDRPSSSLNRLSPSVWDL